MRRYLVQKSDDISRARYFARFCYSLPRTRQVSAIGEEVGGIGNENNEAALNLRVSSEVGHLEEEGRHNTDEDTDDQAAEEDDEEDAETLEETDEAHPGGVGLVLLSSFEYDNGDGVIQNRLAKDDGVQLRIDLVGVENGQDGDGVGSGESCADGDGINEIHLQRLEPGHGIQPEDKTNDDGRQEGSGESKGRYGSNVAEKVGLMQLVAGSENNGWQEQIEENLVVEADQVSDRII